MEHTANDIRELREETGRGLPDIKQALSMFTNREDAKEYLMAVCEPVRCRCREGNHEH